MGSPRTFWHTAFVTPFRHTAAFGQMGVQMITIPELVSQALGAFLTSETKSRFASSHAGLTELLPFAARLTLECIGNSDALYHNIEHSMLVTLAGHDILMGRALSRQTPPATMRTSSWRAWPTTSDTCAASSREMTTSSCRGSQRPHGSPAARIIRCRARALPRRPLETVRLRAPRRRRRGRCDRIARAIEYTRFPYTSSSNDDLIEEEGLLLRAADLIGQLGDPNYLRKANALFYEFEEIGLNKRWATIRRQTSSTNIPVLLE